MAKKKNKRYSKVIKIPVIGKYIDTPTNAELDVIGYYDDAGDFRLSGGTLPAPIILKSCRFQIKISDAKAKKKFFKKLETYFKYSSVREMNQPEQYKLPLLFGLLKIRKGKERRFVLFQSAGYFFNSKDVDILAVVIDNLMYLDLLDKLKEK